MGLFDAIKGLIGEAGIADLAEQVGLGDQLDGVIDAVQQPVEELSSMQEDLGGAVAPITDAAGGLLP